METKNKIKIGVETEGMEEAAAKIEALRNAAESFPAAVNIKAINADAVHISSTNIIDRSAEFIEEIPAIEKEELEPEEIRISWEPVKESLDGILQRTVELVGLNPTRTDETWLWANTMAGALLEVIRKLEEEK